MKLATTAFRDGGVIPAELAFGKPDAKARVVLSANRNPDLAWTGAPAGPSADAAGRMGYPCPCRNPLHALPPDRGRTPLFARQ